MSTDTIYALSTPSGRSAIAVIRITGSQTQHILQHCFSDEAFEPRKAYLRKFTHPKTKETLDQVLFIWFKGPYSYTGEDILELHLHGSAAVIKDVLTALGSIEQCRMAEPGEFSRRAFDNDKMDLTEIEGFADLIDAETSAQRRQALKQADGSLKALYDEWRKRLTKCQAYVEAEIDFPDEDIPDGLSEVVEKELTSLCSELQSHLNDNRRGERLREGFQIALIGEPNTGKSSLLNQLVQREAAIVSSYAGTTRDVIEVHLDLAGYPVIIADTAGIRETDDPIEVEGVRRSHMKAEQADLKLCLVEAGQHSIPFELDETSWLIHNKTDLADGHETKDGFHISAKTGKGIPELLSAIESHLEKYFDLSSEVYLTRERHRQAAMYSLQSMQNCFEQSEKELIAEELRQASLSLGRITGHVNVEDLLDVIFKDFCIGK